MDFRGSEIDFLVRHKGMSAAQVEPMLDRVAGIAHEVGLEYDFDALQHTNTIKAHQLIHYAKAHGKQLEAKERLLKAYFVEGRHVGRESDLADLAAEIGVDREDAKRALETDEYLDAVHADQQQAIEYGVSGAESPETFTQVLNRVSEEKIAA